MLNHLRSLLAGGVIGAGAVVGVNALDTDGIPNPCPRGWDNASLIADHVVVYACEATLVDATTGERQNWTVALEPDNNGDLVFNRAWRSDYLDGFVFDPDAVGWPR